MRETTIPGFKITLCLFRGFTRYCMNETTGRIPAKQGALGAFQYFHALNIKKAEVCAWVLAR